MAITHSRRDRVQLELPKEFPHVARSLYVDRSSDRETSANSIRSTLEVKRSWGMNVRRRWQHVEDYASLPAAILMLVSQNGNDHSAQG